MRTTKPGPSCRASACFSTPRRRGFFMSASLSKIPSRPPPGDDGVVFHLAGVSRIHADALDRPVDLAPAVIETSDTNWAANTTLDVEALCANRGNKTIVRIGKDGTGVAIRRVRLAGGYRLGGLRLNGAPVPRMERGLGLAVTGHLPGAGAGLELARLRKPYLTQARLGLPFR